MSKMLAQLMEDYDKLKDLNAELVKVLSALLEHDYAEDCQECGIGKSPVWQQAKDALPKRKEPSHDHHEVVQPSGMCL